jgi:HlyD family secretion protein
MTRLRNAEGRFFWVLAAAGILVALALIVGSNIQRSNAENIQSTYRTSYVTRGQIEEVVKASGLVTARTANLTFQASGVISDVLVRPGQVVQASQVLSRLDTREAEAQLAAAQAGQKAAQGKLDAIKGGPARDLATAQQNLKIAQARLAQVQGVVGSSDELLAAQNAVDAAVYRYNTVASRTNVKDVASADAALRVARAQLAAVTAPASKAALNEAKARVDATTQNLEKVKSERSSAVEQAQSSIDKAQKGLDAANATYNQIRAELYNPDGTVKETTTPADLAREKAAKLAVDQAKITLDAAQKALEAAKSQQTSAVKEAQALMIESQAALENLQDGPTQQAIQSAQASVDKAQADYDRAAAGGPTQDEINAAQSDINQARALLDRLNKGGNPRDIQVAQSEVDKFQLEVQELSKGASPTDLAQAQGAVDQATAQVRQAQLRIEQLNLLAPFNSVVESINVAPGQAVAPGPVAITLVDLSKPSFEARVNESSIQRIRQGQSVRVTFEGIRGVRQDPFKGKVTLISTSLKNSTATGSTEDSRNLGTAVPAAGANPLNTPAANDQSGFPVTILLDQDTELTTLKPGMTGRARFVLGSKPDVLLVPKVSIRTLEVGPVVDVVLPDGLVVATPVTIGLIGDDYVEIMDTGLLREGDNIVLYGTAPLPVVPSSTPDTTGTNPGLTIPAAAGTTGTNSSPASPGVTGTPATVSASPGPARSVTAGTLAGTASISPAATPIVIASPGSSRVAGPPVPTPSASVPARAVSTPTPTVFGPTPTPRG